MPHRRDTWGMAASPVRWRLTWVRSPRRASRSRKAAAGRPPPEFVEADRTRGCQAPTDSGMLARDIPVLWSWPAGPRHRRARGVPVSRSEGYYRSIG